MQVENIRNEYYQNGILSKYYQDDNLLLLYTNYSEDHKKFRSKIMEMENQKVISYSFNSPMYNYMGYNYLINNQNCEKKISKCYEGTILSVFNHNNKWYVSTRKCLNAQESVWLNKSFYQMFEETILQDFNNVDEFYNLLNKDYNYHFVLVHWENKNIVDYTEELGDNYKKLVLALVRDKEMKVMDNLNNILPNLDNITSVFIPKEYDNLEVLDEHLDYMSKPKTEGVIVKVKNNDDILIIKLQTNHYQFYKAMGLEHHLYKGFLNLYQKDKLLNFFENNEYNHKYSKLINPHNNSQTYDLVGVIDGVFKVLSQELYCLYHNLYDNDVKKPNNYYNKLPTVYKNIIYKLRGISMKKNNQGLELSLKNIYTLLKMVETDVIYSLLRNRKMMINYNKIKENIFPNLAENIQKIHLKLCAIYTAKLFPDLLDIDTF
jgi:hypothetical protein